VVKDYPSGWAPSALLWFCGGESLLHIETRPVSVYRRPLAAFVLFTFPARPTGRAKASLTRWPAVLRSAEKTKWPSLRLCYWGCLAHQCLR
jgi:hypothetical protein